MSKILIVVVCFIVTCGFHQFSPPWSPYETLHQGNISLIPCQIEIPHAFSPNGDGINDNFNIKSSCELKEFTLQIFDDSQQLILTQDNVYSPWDGRVGGLPVPEGKYEYVVNYRTTNDRRKEIRGDLLLLR